MASKNELIKELDVRTFKKGGSLFLICRHLRSIVHFLFHAPLSHFSPTPSSNCPQVSRTGLIANNGRSEAWQGEVEAKTSSADLELLKWEYRCRALEQEKAGLQRRNASLTSDLKQEFKENKRNNRVINAMLKALVDARQQLQRLDADADTSSVDAALRFALSGKEVVWPDQTGDIADENARSAENKDGQGATFASPKPGKASQSLCMASPDQLHTPTHAEANARAPMRSLSRSISRSKLANSGGGHSG